MIGKFTLKRKLLYEKRIGLVTDAHSFLATKIENQPVLSGLTITPNITKKKTKKQNSSQKERKKERNILPFFSQITFSDKYICGTS